MRQEKIKCNARERKRVEEHSMKRGERGEGEMDTTRGLFFANRREERFVVLFNCAWFFNPLPRISLLVTP